MKLSANTKGVTLVEIVVASSLLLVLLGVSFSFMGVQMDLAKQQSAKAYGNVLSQRVFDKIATLMRDAVLDDNTYATTTPPPTYFCAGASATDRIARLTFYRIQTAHSNPSGPSYDSPNGSLMLQVLGSPSDATTTPLILEVVYPDGSTVLQDADLSAATTLGVLRWGTDLNPNDSIDATNGSGTNGLADESNVVVLSRDVERFRVVDSGLGDQLEVQLVLRRKTDAQKTKGSSEHIYETSTTTGQVLVHRWDPSSME